MTTKYNSKFGFIHTKKPKYKKERKKTQTH